MKVKDNKKKRKDNVYDPSLDLVIFENIIYEIKFISSSIKNHIIVIIMLDRPTHPLHSKSMVVSCRCTQI